MSDFTKKTDLNLLSLEGKLTQAGVELPSKEEKDISAHLVRQVLLQWSSKQVFFFPPAPGITEHDALMGNALRPSTAKPSCRSFNTTRRNQELKRQRALKQLKATVGKRHKDGRITGKDVLFVHPLPCLLEVKPVSEERKQYLSFHLAVYTSHQIKLDVSF